MKSFFNLVPALLLSVCASAQDNWGTITYLDSTNRETTEDKHVYYKIIKDFDEAKDLYEITEYYKSGKIKAKATSTDENGYKYSGPAEVYYENGNLKEKAHYKDGLPTGPYSSWYDNGEKWIDGSHIPDDASEPKTTILRVDQYWDENKVQQVVDGNGIYKETENKATASGPLQKGLKDGVWQGSDKTLNIEFVETYESGTLKTGVSIDENLVERPYTSVLKLAKPKKGPQDFYQFVAKNFKVPEGDDIAGKILLRFTIDKKGAVKDVEVIKGIEEKTDLEAIRVVQLYNKWEIAQSRGIDVACSYSIPINITQAY